MKKIKNPLLLLALGATAVCGLCILNSNSSSLVKAADAPSTTYEVTTPEEYYKYFDDSATGSEFLSDLRTFNMSKRKSNYNYSSLNGIFKYTDYDPATVQYDSNGQPYGTSLLSFYSGKSTTAYNKEHVWPNSRGGGSDKGKSGSPYVEDDVYMPRPTISAENSNRGNSSYVEGMCHSANGWDPVTAFADNIGVYTSIRGESARIIFYCMTVNENLRLVDDANTDFAGIGGRVTMGKLSDMLKWHLTNPVNEREINRNNGGQYLQGNRNAFVDHRSYACKIWGNTNSTTKNLCDTYNGWNDGDDPTPETKTLEKIEVSGTASKKAYYVGDTFDMTGLTVTATFDDNGTKSTSNVTSSVKIEPATLALDTEYVTLSYTYNGTTKSATYDDFTVSERPAINYGTLDNPLNVSDAKLLIEDECPSSGNYTKQQLYVRGEVGSIITDDSTHNRKKIYIHDLNSSSSTMIVESLNMTPEQYNLLETGDEIIFHGFGCNNNETFQFKYTNTSDPTLDRNISKEAIIPVNSVTITNIKTDYYIGETCQITATVLPDNATNKFLTYSSNNTGVATVNDAGEVLFKDVGSATITASSNNGKTATITFNVTKAPVHVTQINVSLPSTSYYVGDTADLNYEVLPKDADNKNVTFESTNTSVATVNSEGEVSFIKAGTVTFKVISSDVKSVYGQVTVTVSERPAEDILVTDIVVDDSLSLIVNEESQISYQVIPTNATDKTVSWSSNNNKVATVDEDGVVKGLSEGTAVITVTANDAGHVSKTINVEVTKPVEVIKVSQINVPSSITVKVNENANIEYEVLPENATDRSVTISSANDEIATINGTKVVGVSEGTTEITISSNDGGATASIPVIVTKGEEPVTKTIAEIAVVNLPDKTTYEIGEDFDKTGLVVNVNYTDGTEENISSQVSLSEVDTSVSGSKTVDVTYSVNEKEYKTSFQVIVLEATVLSINIEKTPAKMNYFADEPLNTYGLVIKATMSDDSVIANVADMCTYTYDFAISNKVQISFSGKQLTMFVTLENVVQEKPVQHKAADFAYVFIEKLESKEPASVSQSEWDALQYYYNKLDTASKEFLKNYKVSSNGNGEVSAEVPEVDALKEFAVKYDAIYSARKADGFTDFIGRASVQPIPGPTPTPTPSSDNKTLIIVIVVICVVAVAIIAIIIPVEIKRSRKGKKNA